jgi:uncharacterized membrane protein
MAGNWHERHVHDYTTGQRVADWTARTLGSWTFIIGQTVFVLVWMGLNVYGWVRHWDPYPFILLNLLFSVQAAYAAPVIMMSQNRQGERDRYQAKADFDTNLKAEKEIQSIQSDLKHILEILEGGDGA